jgi:hypothetical protein
LALGVAILGLIGLAALIVFLWLPFEAKPEAPDWASVWTMRWTAVGSLAATFSMIAIIVTAFYAVRAIETTSTIEKSKRTAELISTFYDRRIVDAQFRVVAAAQGGAHIRYLREFHIIAGFLEECAVTFFADLVDKEIFLDALDYAVNNAWCVTHYIIIPEVEREGSWTDVNQSDALRQICYEHLVQRLSESARDRLLAEEQTFIAWREARSSGPR